MKSITDYIVSKMAYNRNYYLVLLFITGLFAFTFFSGNIVNKSLQKGINNAEKRLGADVMLVPKGAKESAEGILMTGQKGFFYFDKSVYRNISQVEGIKEMTAQCFLKSLSEDCCSSEVEIVFYDPDTDFVVEPWIAKQYSKKQQKNEIVAGFGIECKENKIKLFGREYDVVAQLSKTGTSIDSCVYFTADSMKEVVSAAEGKGVFLTEAQRKDDIISSVFINVEDGVDVNKFVSECHKVAGEEFDAIYRKDLNESLSENYKLITQIISMLTVGGSIIILIILFITIHVVMLHRKQEIALLRILGNTKGRIKEMLFIELAAVSLIGAVAGELFGMLIFIPFENYIGSKLEMPYLGPGFIGLVMEAVAVAAGIIVIVILSSVISVNHVCNMEPYAAIRKEAE